MLVLTVVGCALATAMGEVAHSAEAGAAVPGEQATSSEGIEFFEAHIRPVLVEHCYECHSGDSTVLQANLRLDSAKFLRAGGDSGPAIVPGDARASLLLDALRYESYEMPPSGKLPDETIRHFEHWIAIGAPDPRSIEVTAPQSDDEPTNATAHWAFQAPQKAPLPPIQSTSPTHTDLDRFIVARLEAEGLGPSTQASPRALLRRVYYDLTGLPPSAAELEAFAADPSDTQYAAAVERLLASPHFGERWGRYWLDVARYADTKGYVFQEDRNYPNAYRYRDWVIDSFNQDRPFDEFIIAQLAADQMDDPSMLPAMGFLTLGRRFLNDQNEIINDRIDLVTRGMLGLTVACARCHDHKYDPVSAADYYALHGVFASSQEEAREELPHVLVDKETPVDPYVFLRGNPGNRGPAVERRFLSCLASGNEPIPFTIGSGRRELASAIASRDNPLTARVWANRVWGHLLGSFLVDTPSDFGLRGMPPTHPKLLDWLACELMDSGWSTKHLIRQIVLSSTYRQSSSARAECAAVDPENRLMWRANRRRLDLEALRDSLLVAAGRLDTTMGGPSVSLTDSPFTTRRSVYGFIERQNLPAFFRTFDFANPNTHTPARPQTTSPQQALFLMNSPFVIEQAAHLAVRSEDPATGADSTADRTRRVERMFRYAFGRAPADDELSDALAFIETARAAPGAVAADLLAWQFGWGAVNDADGTVSFQPLPSFVNNTWQGSSALPDPHLGWVLLNAEGGHPGDTAHQAIRRWTAPRAGTVEIEGILAHAASQGDGVRGRIVASQSGVVGSWEVFQSETSTAAAKIQVAKGETIDFVTDCRTSTAFDSFQWTVTLRLVSDGENADQVWDSTSGFHGPLAPPLSAWEQLAQVLLMSNEFAFVD